MKLLVGLCGERRQGKDTVAGIIGEICAEHFIRFTHLAFADHVRSAMCDSFPLGLTPLPLMEVDLTGDSVYDRDSVSIFTLIGEPIHITRDQFFRIWVDSFISYIEEIHGITRKTDDIQYPSTPDTIRSFLTTFGTEIAHTIFGSDVWVEVVRSQFDESKSDGNPTLFVVSDVRFDTEAAMIIEEGGYNFEIIKDKKCSSDAEHISNRGIDPSMIMMTIHNDKSIKELRETVRSVFECQVK